MGNPLRFTDPDGMEPEDIYFFFWEGSDRKPGHAAIAIDEYDSEGNKTGNVTVFELFSGEEYGTFTMPDATLDADYKVHSGLSLEDAQARLGPDGVIQVSSSMDQDQEALSTLQGMVNNADAWENKYNAESNNCCDIVVKGLDAVYADSETMGNTYVEFKMHELTFNKGEVTNPNKLWNDLRKRPGTTILKGPDRDYDSSAPQKFLNSKVKEKKG